MQLNKERYLYSYCKMLDKKSTRCCSCSFGLQAAYVLLSGTSVNYKVETEQSQVIRGKTEDILSIWPALTKIGVLCNALMCIIKFRFSKPRVAVVTLCCFKIHPFVSHLPYHFSMKLNLLRSCCNFSHFIPVYRRWLMETKSKKGNRCKKLHIWNCYGRNSLVSVTERC